MCGKSKWRALAMDCGVFAAVDFQRFYYTRNVEKINDSSRCFLLLWSKSIEPWFVSFDPAIFVSSPYVESASNYRMTFSFAPIHFPALMFALLWATSPPIPSTHRPYTMRKMAYRLYLYTNLSSNEYDYVRLCPATISVYTFSFRLLFLWVEFIHLIWIWFSTYKV